MRPFLGVVFFGGWAAGSVALAAAAADPALTADTPWSYTATVRAAVGWRDNVLLSPFQPLARAYSRGECETFSHWAHQDWEAYALLNGEVLRYFSPPPETGGEQLWFGHAEWRWRRWPAAQLSLKADAFLQDAVVDLSETETVRTVAPVRALGGFTTAALRCPLPGGFTVTPLGQLRQTDYRSFAGDYAEVRWGAQLKWQRPGLELQASAYEHRRRYDDRPQVSAGGRSLAGTHLRFWQRVGELKATTSWTAAGEWSLAVLAGRTENRDRASGFFDTDQRRWEAEIEWRPGAWQVTLAGERRRYVYLHQTVGTGTQPPSRAADYDEASLRVVRTLTPAWGVFGHYRWERCQSNEPGFSYRSNNVLAGVQRTF